eukprot:GHVN01068671.1.p1 GENE.GHVN01068671.1~~GHVN01068671.1.p1  ORF type:complete len:157 (-),score=9.74 GHVN01068671.1:86-532(-)
MPPNLCSQNEMRPDQPYGPMDRCPPWMPLPHPPQAAIANHPRPSHCVPTPSRDKASSIGFAVLAAGIVMSVARKDTSAAETKAREERFAKFFDTSGPLAFIVLETPSEQGNKATGLKGWLMPLAKFELMVKANAVSQVYGPNRPSHRF